MLKMGMVFSECKIERHKCGSWRELIFFQFVDYLFVVRMSVVYHLLPIMQTVVHGLSKTQKKHIRPSAGPVGKDGLGERGGYRYCD